MESLKRLPEKPASEVPEHDPATHTKSKLLDPKKWDATQTLFKSGGHMPLIGYFGNISSRSQDALQKREAASVRRGWGPEPGGKRSALMQKQGKGPPPSVQRAQAAAASAAAEQTKGQTKGQSSSDTWVNDQWSHTWSSAWWSS